MDPNAYNTQDVLKGLKRVKNGAPGAGKENGGGIGRRGEKGDINLVGYIPQNMNTTLPFMPL